MWRQYLWRPNTLSGSPKLLRATATSLAACMTSSEMVRAAALSCAALLETGAGACLTSGTGFSGWAGALSACR